VGGQRAEFVFDIRGRTETDMGWQVKSLRFFAVESHSRIEFISPIDSAGGPALDNVSLVLLPHGFIRGDTNRDERVDVSDGLCILMNLFWGTYELECLDAADANDSGSIDVSDAVRIFNFLFLGAEPPPWPFPHCGLDTTEDFLDCAAALRCTDA
jgi:hypothetical protein